jgi:hypothetical protein
MLLQPHLQLNGIKELTVPVHKTTIEIKQPKTEVLVKRDSISLVDHQYKPNVAESDIMAEGERSLSPQGFTDALTPKL